MIDYWDAGGIWVRGGKKRAKERCRTVVAGTPIGQCVAQADAEFLAELLRHHPHAAQKIGCGIAHLSTEIVEPYRTRGLRLYRLDGTSTDFSWLECISSTSHDTQVKSAMRLVIDSQILAFKHYMEDNGWLRCAITGEDLIFSTAVADHVPPVEFRVISDTYAEYYGGYKAIALIPSRDNLYGDKLAPPHDVGWPRYHRQNARLQILCKPCHVSVTNQRKG